MSQKGMILAGGTGTRLFPLTKMINKHLLPIYDKPMIYYPLSTLMEMGIRDILIISTEKDINRYKELLGDGKDLGIQIRYTIQNSPAGIAQSFLLGEEFIGRDSVTLILGDNIFYKRGGLFNIHREGQNTVFAKAVDEPSKYGVVDKDAEGNVVQLIEKPKNPPTNFAVTGLYVYDNKSIEIAKGLKPSDRGEYEITDINNVYLQKGLLKVETLDDDVTWYDAGGFDAMFKSSAFVKGEQERSGELVGSPEVIAFRRGWINQSSYEALASKVINSGYGQKLLDQISKINS